MPANMDKITFYRLLKEGVQVMPQSTNIYDALQSFAVLRSRTDANAENLNKNVLYKDKAFFYSRKWEQLGFSESKLLISFPILMALELPGEIKGPFTTKSKVVNRIQLMAGFPNQEYLEENHLTLPNMPVMEEIYELMLNHLLWIMNYISRSIYASVDGGDYAWYNEDKLIYQKDQAEISNYTKHSNETNFFRKRMQINNETITHDYLDDAGTHKLVGKSIIFNFEETTCPTIAPTVFTSKNCCNQL